MKISFPKSSLAALVGFLFPSVHCFIRCTSRNTRGQRVLARYVQMAAVDGITQAIFLWGWLSLNSQVGQAKLGWPSYIVAGGDVVFVPVGIACVRVLEGRILVKAAAKGGRCSRGKSMTMIAIVLRTPWCKLRGDFNGFGTAAAAFRPPVSLWARAQGTIDPRVLATHLMSSIEKVVPILALPVVVAAI